MAGSHEVCRSDHACCGPIPTVVRARNLKAADPNGKSDPYCILSVDGGGTEYQTKLCLATLEPEWNQSFTFAVAPPQGVALGYDSEEMFGSYLKVTSYISNTFDRCHNLVVVTASSLCLSLTSLLTEVMWLHCVHRRYHSLCWLVQVQIWFFLW